MGDAVKVADGARLFLASLSAADRQAYSQEVNRFTRWFGAGKLVSDIGSLDVELYAEELVASTSDPSLRAEAVKAFLSYAKQQGWTASNLATLIKVRRPSTRKESRGGQRPTKVVQLTSEGHQKIKDDLDTLIRERPKIVDELQRARADKDFRENAPLDAARQHQAQVEGRIRELEATLKSASIIDQEQMSDSRIGMGTRVVVWDLLHHEEITFTLVSPNEVNLKTGRISVVSPTGKALVGKQAGDEIEVIAPVGTFRYRVVRVER